MSIFSPEMNGSNFEGFLVVIVVVTLINRLVVTLLGPVRFGAANEVVAVRV